MKYNVNFLRLSKIVCRCLAIFFCLNPFFSGAQDLVTVKGLKNIAPFAGILADEGRGIAVDRSGNVYVTGYFSGTVDFDPGVSVVALTSSGNEDIFIAKYNTIGELIYAKAIGGINKDVSNSIAIDKSGNTFITGYFTGTVDFDPGDAVTNITSAANSVDIFIARYDAGGNFVYAKALGGPGEDLGSSLGIDGAGNVYVTGTFKGTANFSTDNTPVILSANAGGQDIFLAKYDLNGSYMYAKAMGGTGDDGGYGIAVDSVGNTYITGDFTGMVDFDPGPGNATLTSIGFNDLFAAHYDASGNYIYAKGLGTFATQPYGKYSGYNIVIDRANNAYVTGYFSYTPTSIARYSNFLAKLDAFGNIKFDMFLSEGTSTRQGPAIAVDNAGNSYITGSFIHALSNPGGTPSSWLTLNDSHNIFISKYDSSGKYVYSKPFLGAGNSFGCAIATDNQGNFYITGSFTDTVNFNPGSGNSNATLTTTNQDIYIAKFRSTITLPIKLESFSATPLVNGNMVQVNWRVSAQINNAYFEVQRSKDGQQFESVGKIQGCSSCNTDQEFEWKDITPYTGISYYRLKQVDIDNKIVYSQIVAVRILKNTFTVNLINSINPGECEIIIENGQAEKEALIQLLNSRGNVIKEQRKLIAIGKMKISYDLSNVAAGIYYVRISDKQGWIATPMKFIKH